jgi:pyridoxal phosphate enzyme (YggS family)
VGRSLTEALAGVSAARPDVETVRSNLAAVRARIEAAGGDVERVTVVVAAKRFDAATVRTALHAGLCDVGESYAQELASVATELDAALDADEVRPRWHFIGRIQRNKVRRIAELVTLWHSVDRLTHGEAIARVAPGAGVLVQVNTTGEPQKGGCEPAAAEELVEGLRAVGLDVRGVMTIGPPGPPEGARVGFRAVAELADRLGLVERSMGMTADLEVAVQEGATIVRVGTGLLGARPVGSK